jgi:hypothetical protein
VWDAIVDITIVAGEYAVQTVVAFGLIIGALITERILGWYFKKCISLGLQEYEGHPIENIDPSQYERWQRIYMFYLERRITLGFIQQVPYYVATIIVLIVVFAPLAMITEGMPQIWLLFPFWIVVLTWTTCQRASREIYT